MTGEGLKKNLLRPIVNLSWPNPVARRTMLLLETLGFKLSSWAHTSASQVSILAFNFFGDVIRDDVFKCLSRRSWWCLGWLAWREDDVQKKKSFPTCSRTRLVREPVKLYFFWILWRRFFAGIERVILFFLLNKNEEQSIYVSVWSNVNVSNIHLFKFGFDYSNSSSSWHYGRRGTRIGETIRLPCIDVCDMVPLEDVLCFCNGRFDQLTCDL